MMINLKHWLFSISLFIVATSNSFAATQVEFKTSEGDFTVELYPEKAPVTVANFLQYAKDNFYAKTIFHRVINDFMIQGGGFERDLYEKPTRDPIINEAANGLENDSGTIAMARTQSPNSATAQFFINLKDNDFLNHTGSHPSEMGYCVFGKVVSGMNVVKKIAIIPTANVGRFEDVPTKAITIKSVKLLEKVTTQ
jgi:cyclophilin family peptidyl-prolyl cis-trans isomerase